jgi:hypothetical protein
MTLHGRPLSITCAAATEHTSESQSRRDVASGKARSRDGAYEFALLHVVGLNGHAGNFNGSHGCRELQSGPQGNTRRGKEKGEQRRRAKSRQLREHARATMRK